MAKLLGELFKREHPVALGVHELSYVEEGVLLEEGVRISPFSYIGRGAKIGANTVIYPFVFIGENVEIGRDCVIYPMVSIREEVRIGNRVIIHSGAVIGSDGYGYIPSKESALKIPQVGIVVIEDDVEIGANVTIDRATVGETRIGRGSKIDNLVHIA
ncbi:MAG: UDP-3-O-(3-hydroxymyristoyl)glucosamine N-acyltransferase, partial [Chloroflexi bacterium]|nr:UDP-3-O-(3-hydroxymyristoyl)glucosamine N-acyltransferase [Chloroflexota bacterium]